MTFTANQRLTIVLSFLAALFVTAVVSYSIGHVPVDQNTNAQDSVLFDCEVEDVSEDRHTEDFAALLRNAGWTGVPFDGGERLYSPACNVEITEDSVTAWDIDGNAVFTTSLSK